jgi:hypothetical protein
MHQLTTSRRGFRYHTDPALVTMEMDLGWVVAAGHDPFQYFSRYPGRFPLWHLKVKVDLKGSIRIDYDYLANLNY